MTNSEEAGLAWAIGWMSLYSFTHCLLFTGSKILVISLADGEKAKVVASGAITMSTNVFGYGMGQAVPGIILKMLINGGTCDGITGDSVAADGPCGRANSSTLPTPMNCSGEANSTASVGVAAAEVCPRAFALAFLALSLTSFIMFAGYATTWGSSSSEGNERNERNERNGPFTFQN